MVNSNLNIQVKRYVPSIEDLNVYIRERNDNIGRARSNFNDFLKNRYFYNKKNVVVIADLSDQKLEGMDLKGVDFSGSQISNTSFENCDLSDAILRDVNLDNTYFKDSALANLDLRGADLETCRFDASYKYYGQEGNAAKISGIKLSSTYSQVREYAGIKAAAIQKQENHKLIKAKESELNAAYTNVSYRQAFRIQLGYISGNEKYDKLASELNVLKSNTYQKDQPINQSISNIFGQQSFTFDPIYKRGSLKGSMDIEKVYIPFSREDLLNYIDAIKIRPDLSINKFTKELVLSRGKNIAENVKVVADLSSEADNHGNWQRKDFTNMDLSNIKMKNVLCSGSDFSNSNFTSADISGSSLEGSKLHNATFHNVNAVDANLANAALNNANFVSSNFKRAYMPRSVAKAAKIDECIFDYANISKANLDNVKMTDAAFNYVNLSGASLAYADIQKIQMQHANISKAIMQNAEIVQSNLQSALMDQVQAQEVKIQNSILKDLKANAINLEKAEIDKLTSMEGADLDHAIMNHLKAKEVNFNKAKLNFIDAQFANFEQALLEKAEMQFADLKNATLDKANAEGINLTGSILEGINAKYANLKGAYLRDIKAQKAKFIEAQMQSVDACGADLQEALLNKVNLEKSRLHNAVMNSVDLKDASLDHAQVNIATKIVYPKNIEQVQGKLDSITTTGKKVVRDLQDHVKEQTDINVIKTGFMSKVYDKIPKEWESTKAVAGVIRNVTDSNVRMNINIKNTIRGAEAFTAVANKYSAKSERFFKWIENKLNSWKARWKKWGKLAKTGIIIGGSITATLGVAVVLPIVITAGTILGIGGLGYGVYKLATLKHSLSEHVKSTLQYFKDTANNIRNNTGITKEQVQLRDEQRECEADYKPVPMPEIAKGNAAARNADFVAFNQVVNQNDLKVDLDKQKIRKLNTNHVTAKEEIKRDLSKDVKKLIYKSLSQNPVIERK